MVKVTNRNGDVKTGKQGTAVYQGFYGNQIRRKWDGHKKCDSAKQLEVQARFKDGVSFMKSLSDTEKSALIKYVESRGLKIGWNDYAKLISMKRPTYESTSETSILVMHPAIASIERYDQFNDLLETIDDLTVLSESIISTSKEISIIDTSVVVVKTADGKSYNLNFTPISGGFPYTFDFYFG